MNQMIELLQYIARIAYKSQQTLKTIELYYADCFIANIRNLYIFLEAVKTNSIKSTLELVTQTNYRELEESLQIINNNVEASEEIYKMIKQSIPCSVPENIKYMLDANIKSLMKYFVLLNPLIIKFLEKEETRLS